MNYVFLNRLIIVRKENVNMDKVTALIFGELLGVIIVLIILKYANIL